MLKAKTLYHRLQRVAMAAGVAALALSGPAQAGVPYANHRLLPELGAGDWSMQTVTFGTHDQVCVAVHGPQLAFGEPYVMAHDCASRAKPSGTFTEVKPYLAVNASMLVLTVPGHPWLLATVKYINSSTGPSIVSVSIVSRK